MYEIWSQVAVVNTNHNSLAEEEMKKNENQT